MEKFHINTKGEVRLCKAIVKDCPYGNEKNHYNSRDAARLAYETSRSSFSKSILELQQELQEKYQKLTIELRHAHGGHIVIDTIKLPKNMQSMGTGSKVMNDITNQADVQGWRLSLSPSLAYGASSINRLERFYERFDFKSNRGSKRDFSVSELMIREPKLT